MTVTTLNFPFFSEVWWHLRAWHRTNFCHARFPNVRMNLYVETWLPDYPDYDPLANFRTYCTDQAEHGSLHFPLEEQNQCSKDLCFQSIAPRTRCFKNRKQVLNHLKCWRVHSQTHHSCSNVFSKSTAPWFCMFWHAYVHVCAWQQIWVGDSWCVFKDRLIVQKNTSSDGERPKSSRSVQIHVFCLKNPKVHRWNRQFSSITSTCSWIKLN